MEGHLEDSSTQTQTTSGTGTPFHKWTFQTWKDRNDGLTANEKHRYIREGHLVGSKAGRRFLVTGQSVAGFLEKERIIAEVPSFGQTTTEYDSGSHGAEDYRVLAHEIIKRER